jgi:mono/diheme cytochrome c family protein
VRDQIQSDAQIPSTKAGRSQRLPFFLCYLLSAICYSTTAGAGSGGGGTGEKIFQTRCFVCHGRDGRGSGPASQGLAQKPQDLTDPNWQRSVTDEQIKTVVRAGGAIFGKSGAMPPNPDLSNDDLSSILDYVRHLVAAPLAR